MPPLRYNASMAAALSILESVGRAVHFGGRALSAALSASLRPRVWGRQLFDVLAGAVPLGLVAGAALGAIVWLHLHDAVEPQYQYKVPEFLALGVVLEFAPLGAGLVVAGRSGASLAAELSSMRLT